MNLQLSLSVFLQNWHNNFIMLVSGVIIPISTYNTYWTENTVVKILFSHSFGQIILVNYDFKGGIVHWRLFFVILSLTFNHCPYIVSIFHYYNLIIHVIYRMSLFTQKITSRRRENKISKQNKKDISNTKIPQKSKAWIMDCVQTLSILISNFVVCNHTRARHNFGHLIFICIFSMSQGTIMTIAFIFWLLDCRRTKRNCVL